MSPAVDEPHPGPPRPGGRTPAPRRPRTTWRPGLTALALVLALGPAIAGSRRLEAVATSATDDVQARALITVPAERTEPQAPTRSSVGSPDPRARPVTVALTGDVLVHTGVWETARRDAAARGERGLDFAPMFADVAPLVAGADLGICHLETPVSPPGGPFQNYPLFAAPPTVLDGLVATGYDACTTASNHSVDQGVEGLLRTLRALDARDLAHTGTFASRQASRRPLVLEVRGVRLGVISMTYGTNGMPVDVPYAVNLLDVPRALAQARALHRDGVDVVMVAIHAGSEYLHEPSDQQRQVFDALTRSPFVDFVYGHHAHVVQPFDRVNGKWVLYGLGNLVAQQSPDLPDTFRGIVAQVTLIERRDGTYRVGLPRYAPTLIMDPTTTGATRVLDVRRVLRDPGAPAWQRRLAAEAARSTDGVMARSGVGRLTPSAR